MADKTISALTAASTPLAGTEVLPIVQSSTTKKVSVANLTAGRAVSAAGLTDTTLTQGSVLFAGAGGAHTQDNANFFWDNTNNRLGIGTAAPSATLHASGGSTTLASLFTSTSTATYATTALNAGRIQLSGAGGTNYTNGIQFSQGGSSELFFGQVQESGGAGRFVWQGYTGAAYRQLMSLSAATGQVGFTSVSGAAYAATGFNGTNALVYLTGVGGSGNINGIEFSAGGSNENFFGIVQESGGAGAFVFQGYNGAAYIERARFDGVGNLLVGTTTSPTTGTRSISIGTGTAPTASAADTITLYSSDVSAGNTTLSLYTEGTPVSNSSDATVTRKIAIRVNGTLYYLLADTDNS